MNTESTKKTEEEKEVQYYSALVNAWFTTKLEKDKTLITLSAGAIGLLVTLITTVGTSNLFVLISFILAILCFITCTISLIYVFDRNAIYLEKLKDNQSVTDQQLKCFDKITFWSFILGIVLAFIIGLSAGIEKYSKSTGGHFMSIQQNKSSGNSGGQRSFNGAGNMRPSPSSGTQSGASQSGNNNSNAGGSTNSQSSSSNSTSKK
jgi:energy-converting hydrogenase Eha subunit E